MDFNLFQPIHHQRLHQVFPTAVAMGCRKQVEMEITRCGDSLQARRRLMLGGQAVLVMLLIPGSSKKDPWHFRRPKIVLFYAGFYLQDGC